MDDVAGLTHAIPHGCYRSEGSDSQGRTIIRTTKDIYLPGGACIPARSGGTLKYDADGIQIVTWYEGVPAWALLLEILRTYAGLRHVDEKTYHTPEGADFVCLSVEDMKIQGSASTNLTAGFKLLKSVLHPSLGVAGNVLASIKVGDEPPAVRVLQLVLAVLEGSRHNAGSTEDTTTSVYALDILQHLIAIPDQHTWALLRNSTFFGGPTRRKGLASALIQADSARGDHTITLSILRVIRSLIDTTANPTTTHPDEMILRAGIHIAISEIWSQYLGWRYNDPAVKYEITHALVEVFDEILRHPLLPDGSAPTGIAQNTIDVFIVSANAFTYRPILEVLSLSGSTVRRLIATGRKKDAEMVVRSVEGGLGFLQTLLRISHGLGVSAMSLPKSLFASLTPDRVPLIDAVFSLAIVPTTQTSTKLKSLRTLRTYLESVSADPQRPSLAGLLTDTARSLEGVANLARSDHSGDTRAAAWSLLATIISTQPGSSSFATSSPSDKEMSGTLHLAVSQIISDDLDYHPQALASTLQYIQSILISPSTGKSVAALRTHDQFWTSIRDIATRPVPPPPTFELSLHSDDFPERIKQYTYETLVKANAISVLASELALSGDMGGNGVISGVFRNADGLMELVRSVGWNSCLPALHEKEGRKLKGYGVELPGLKTVALVNEREYGLHYLYGMFDLR
jgi:nuclear pore complex protein Nup188